VQVEGDSMRPALEPGDRLLVIGRLPVRPGHLVALPDPRRPDRLLVKRVAAVGGDGVEVRGDNPAASTDSTSFGPVPAASIVGRAVWRYWPADRAGPLTTRS
jgi:nickel-type superoxide dismutase maturation protease